jgi:23S rRNA pseudouridine1911/1915/1917 synthase
MSKVHITKTAEVSLTGHGKRADVVLADLFPDYSRSQLSSWLKEGLITFNKKVVRPKDKVFEGDEVNLQVDFTTSDDEGYLAQALPLNIVFEDDYLLIINKPAGLVVHPGAGNPSSTLVNGLVHYNESLNQLPRAGIVHRLDKDTTGLLIVAKTLTAYTALVRQMQNREINRQYKALVYGDVISGDKIETYFARHPKNRLKMAVTRQGKEAVTEFSVLKRYEQYTLLDVKLWTGRTHQIRVHMAHIRHPIVGDQLYAGRKHSLKHAPGLLKNAIACFSRQALHAYHLSLMHPETHEDLTFTAPMPDDFYELISLLDNEDEDHIS